MTSDEALKVWLPVIHMGVENMLECKEALEMAIKALEQQKNEWQAGYDMAWKEAEVVFEKEPLKECENAISRKEVLDLCDSNDPEYKISHLKEDVECLPPVQPQQRWIPVSERLPEKNMACLVTVGEFNLTQMAVYSDLMGTIDHRIFYQGVYGGESFENITQYVKAWMPLPKPYKASPTGAKFEEVKNEG